MVYVLFFSHASLIKNSQSGPGDSFLENPFNEFTECAGDREEHIQFPFAHSDLPHAGIPLPCHIFFYTKDLQESLFADFSAIINE
jgi:hypothetical protein